MTDFENRKYRDSSGKVVLDASGNPILYKYFLNDLPDEKHEREGEKNHVSTVIDLLLLFGMNIPESMKSEVTDEKIEARKKYWADANIPIKS